MPSPRSVRRAPASVPPARGRLRGIAAGAASALVAVTLAVTGGGAATAAAPCPPVDDYRNLHNGAFLGTDDNVNVYVGGDLSVTTGAAEAEGLVVVGGDLSIATDHYNVGVAGVGSRVPPTAGVDMLVVGGSITVASGTLDVGNPVGGDIVVGGTVTGSHTANGGTVTQNAAAPLAPYAGIPAQIAQASAQYAALAPTGSYVSEPWGVTFVGDGTSAVQVFSIPGDQLGTVAAPRAQDFTGIPAGATIIINVTGSSAVVSANSTSLDGTPVNPISTTDFTFSQLTQSILWNFPTATDVTLGGSSQLLGSVLVPAADSTLTVVTSTNGRVLTNGDLVQGGTGAGLEFHSFPFRGAGTCTIPEAVEATGAFSVAKTLENPDGVAGLPSSYTVEYSTDDGTTWTAITVAPGSPTTVSNLAAGTEVLLREVIPDAVAGGVWAAPDWTDDAITIVADTNVSVTVTNTIVAASTPAFSTVAWVNDDGVTKELPLTGGTVTDRISYTGLTPGVAYRFDGWLVRADGAAGTPLGVSQSTTFTPGAPSGTMTMDWVVTPELAVANAGERVVIYLELYEVDGATTPVATDLDIESATEWFRVAEAQVDENPGGSGGGSNGSGDPADPTARLPITGAAPATGLAAAGLLIAFGAVAFALARRRRLTS